MNLKIFCKVRTKSSFLHVNSNKKIKEHVSKLMTPNGRLKPNTKVTASYLNNFFSIRIHNGGQQICATAILFPPPHIQKPNSITI